MTFLHSVWRLLPARQRREALFGAMSLLAPRPAYPIPDGAGPVTVAGYFGAPSGLGEGVRRLANMLEAAGSLVHRADLSAALRQSPDLPGLQPAPPGPGTLLVHVNGPLLPWGMFALGRAAVARKRILAVWNWELPSVPRDWDRGFRFVHGILATSHFSAGAMARPGGPPVGVIHYPVPQPEPAAMGRADLDLPADAFISLSIFDASSVIERKNPLGAIAAHTAAFGHDPSKILLLKTYNTGMAGPGWQEVVAAAAAAPNVRILDQRLTREEIWSLIALCDVFVSLHRSEGVGLALLEAMRLGRPVLATGWSGNMDFMDERSAALVPYTLVPARDSRGVYSAAGAVWAEPDTGAAAQLLRRLARDEAWRHGLTEAGRSRIASLDEGSCGRRALQVLAETRFGGNQQPGTRP